MAAKGKTYDTHAIGRRKTAVARVYMATGSGKITVSTKETLKISLNKKQIFMLLINHLNLTKIS
jgi:small subunit ribosomal protein S9